MKFFREIYGVIFAWYLANLMSLNQMTYCSTHRAISRCSGVVNQRIETNRWNTRREISPPEHKESFTSEGFTVYMLLHVFCLISLLLFFFLLFFFLTKAFVWLLRSQSWIYSWTSKAQWLNEEIESCLTLRSIITLHFKTAQIDFCSPTSGRSWCNCAGIQTWDSSAHIGQYFRLIWLWKQAKNIIEYVFNKS